MHTQVVQHHRPGYTACCHLSSSSIVEKSLSGYTWKFRASLSSVFPETSQTCKMTLNIFFFSSKLSEGYSALCSTEKNSFEVMVNSEHSWISESSIYLFPSQYLFFLSISLIQSSKTSVGRTLLASADFVIACLFNVSKLISGKWMNEWMNLVARRIFQDSQHI